MCFPHWKFSVTLSLCTNDSLKGLVVEGVAGGDPVLFLGHSLLMTFLCVKGH